MWYKNTNSPGDCQFSLAKVKINLLLLNLQRRRNRIVTMKVLMINGSPRQKGNTSIALAEIAGQLEKHGIESEIVWIGNKPLRGCIVCNSCKQRPGACAFDDDVCNGISAKMNGADALIVGSPVYYGQPNGALMAIVQRMLYSNGAAFRGKPAAAVAVCRRGGATAAFQTLNMPFQMLNLSLIHI